jgi:Fur family ferric uptake transcriptional regulator
LRWTSQRRTLVEVLRDHEGHVTATELIIRCREVDPTTTPSTVYRTLDVLEDLGLVRHGHGPDGREEYHVLPQATHGHLHCTGCGQTWEIRPATGALISGALAADLGFAVDLSHVTVSGLCEHCKGPAEDRPATDDA